MINTSVDFYPGVSEYCPLKWGAGGGSEYCSGRFGYLTVAFAITVGLLRKIIRHHSDNLTTTSILEGDGPRFGKISDFFGKSTVRSGSGVRKPEKSKIQVEKSLF